MNHFCRTSGLNRKLQTFVLVHHICNPTTHAQERMCVHSQVVSIGDDECPAVLEPLVAYLLAANHKHVYYYGMYDTKANRLAPYSPLRNMTVIADERRPGKLCYFSLGISCTSNTIVPRFVTTAKYSRRTATDTQNYPAQ